MATYEGFNVTDDWGNTLQFYTSRTYYHDLTSWNIVVKNNSIESQRFKNTSYISTTKQKIRWLQVRTQNSSFICKLYKYCAYCIYAYQNSRMVSSCILKYEQLSE